HMNKPSPKECAAQDLNRQHVNDAAVEVRRTEVPKEGAVTERRCSSQAPRYRMGSCNKLSQKTGYFRGFHCEFGSGRQGQVKDIKVKEKAPKEEMKSVWDRKKGVPEQKAQNGERELTAPKLKSTENAFGRAGGLLGVSTANAEAGSEKLKEKQQEAAVELDELKKRREERRKILEEEEQKKKQEEAERKIREEEEKKRMKEEIERRRAEAAEKRQKVPEDGVSEEKKPFKCFSPKGSSLKVTSLPNQLPIWFLMPTASILLQGNKAAKPAKPAASDLPVPAEGVRNIKSMWEKGNVFSSPGGTGTPNKETAGLKVGVSSRINEWLTKTPEGNKSPAPKPSVS
uniref:Caldesmon 1 n=1 Tax=Pavo cristatus TaxID=9049 RepID=A0A8C9EWE0_PAVCR